jgi:hypothetical protein
VRLLIEENIVYLKNALAFLKIGHVKGKRASNTSIVPAEPEIPWRVSHLSIIKAQSCLTSVFQWELVYPTCVTPIVSLIEWNHEENHKT